MECRAEIDLAVKEGTGSLTKLLTKYNFNNKQLFEIMIILCDKKVV
jgi:hypothetical protein